MSVTKLNEQQRQTLEAVGFINTGGIGGLPKKTYYTPDGRMIRAVISMRQYIKKDAQGNVIETGTRDANLDQGWLTEKPTVLKPHCQSCNKWHDTQAQVRACWAHQKAFIARATRQAKSEETKKTQGLEDRVAELEALVMKLTGGQVGQAIQPVNSEPNGSAAEQHGGAKAAVQ